MPIHQKRVRACHLARRFAVAILAVSASVSAFAADASRDFWHDIQARPLPADAPQVALFRSLELDVERMRAKVASARNNGAAITVSLPTPDGGFVDFVLADSRVMPAALQNKYPGIVSLAGSDAVGHKARVDFSSQGFQAMVFDHDGIWVVRPETLASGNRYLSFRRADLAVPGQAFQCGVHGDNIDASGRSLIAQNPSPFTSTGATTRVYRAAVAANHNYVNAVCSGNATVECGLGQVVMAVNRVDEVYETEVAVHMTLIDNNDEIIYPVAAGDPYSNNGNALNQNQSNLDSVIGSANYDIGHVFTTGSGGVAGLRVTCVNGNKARGTTGLGNPTGDAFYIDYVAHEMGHQFGGNHTFNSTLGSCGGGNRAGSAAYEPGSGTTIMAYAGICGADDTQPHSDPYFHAKSLEEINNWIGGNGGSCAADAANPDAGPVIDASSLTANVTIPMQTAFSMSGDATDADGDDTLSYNWEQYDLGPAQPLSAGDTGAGPIFRSFNATISNTRIFPQLASVLSGTLVKGEAYPSTTRDLNFRLTVRDNHDVPGTPQYGATQSADTVIHVSANAGPFVVTAPNTAITWAIGDAQSVTWDVANTTAAPVSCNAVDIDLSTDGGESFATSLANGVPNNGSASVIVPDVAATSEARVRVACANNVFFDVSNVDFAIVAGGGGSDPIASVTPTSLQFEVDSGTGTSGSIDIANDADATTSLTFAITESTDGCATTSDVPWLATTPDSGNVSGGESASVSIAIDAGDLPPGTDAASLCIATNDPLQAQIVVDVEVTVADGGGDDVIFSDGFDGGGAGNTPPSVAKNFDPALIDVAAASTLTITLDNPNATDATLSSILTDNFPDGLVVASTPAAATTCASGNVSATAGDGAVSLAAGAVIPANGSCAVTVAVSSASEGTYVNTIPIDALQTDLGNNVDAASATLTVGATGANPVQDPSFEATDGNAGDNPFWLSVDGNPGADGRSVFYSVSSTGDSVQTHTGIYAAWFGGWRSGDAEVQEFSQSVTMPSAAPAFINYWRFIEVAPDTQGSLTVSVDGTAVQTIDLSTLAADDGYEVQSVPIDSYADGAAHDLKFTYDYAGGAEDGNIFVDDVTVDATAARGLPHRVKPIVRNDARHK